VLADFSDTFSESQWKKAPAASGELSWPALHDFLVRWQNPREADALTRVQVLIFFCIEKMKSK
jgi:hypothetical protein